MELDDVMALLMARQLLKDGGATILESLPDPDKASKVLERLRGSEMTIELRDEAHELVDDFMRASVMLGTLVRGLMLLVKAKAESESDGSDRVFSTIPGQPHESEDEHCDMHNKQHEIDAAVIACLTVRCGGSVTITNDELQKVSQSGMKIEADAKKKTRSYTIMSRDETMVAMAGKHSLN